MIKCDLEKRQIRSEKLNYIHCQWQAGRELSHWHLGTTIKRWTEFSVDSLALSDCSPNHIFSQFAISQPD